MKRIKYIHGVINEMIASFKFLVLNMWVLAYVIMNLTGHYMHPGLLIGAFILNFFVFLPVPSLTEMKDYEYVDDEEDKE